MLAEIEDEIVPDAGCKRLQFGKALDTERIVKANRIVTPAEIVDLGETDVKYSFVR